MGARSGKRTCTPPRQCMMSLALCVAHTRADPTRFAAFDLFPPSCPVPPTTPSFRTPTSPFSLTSLRRFPSDPP